MEPRIICSASVKKGDIHTAKPDSRNMFYMQFDDRVKACVCADAPAYSDEEDDGRRRQESCMEYWAKECGPTALPKQKTENIGVIVSTAVFNAMKAGAISFNGSGYGICGGCADNISFDREDRIIIDSKGMVFGTPQGDHAHCITDYFRSNKHMPQIIMEVSIGEVVKYADPFRETAGNHTEEQIFARP